MRLTVSRKIVGGRFRYLNSHSLCPFEVINSVTQTEIGYKGGQIT